MTDPSSTKNATKRARVGTVIRRRTISSSGWYVVIAFAAGVLGEALYAIFERPWLGTFSSSLLFSLASVAAGALFGFLFGIPHSNSKANLPSTGRAIQDESLAPTSHGPAKELSLTIAPSTILEEVADWLSKLILGASLTQIGRLPHGSYVLFHAMAAALGSTKGSIAFAGGVVIYFAGAGFVVGWLSSYFALTPAIVRLQRSLTQQVLDLQAQAVRAEREGDQATAGRLRAASRAQLETFSEVVSRYEQTFARPRSDPGRVRSLDLAIADAANSFLAEDPSQTDVFRRYQSGSQREREIALAAMAADPDLASFGAVLDSIEHSRSAIEQFQAFRVALGLTPSLSNEQGAELRRAVTHEVDSAEHFSRASARYRLAQELLSRLPQQDTNAG